MSKSRRFASAPIVGAGLGLAVFSPLPQTDAALIPVYIVAGQSNAVGNKALTSQLAPSFLLPQSNVLFFGPTHETAVKTWNPIQPPTETTQVSDGSGFGPELTAGQALSTAAGGQTVGIVKFAINGTNLFSQWNPDNAGQLYDQMMTRVNQSLAALTGLGHTPVVSGFLWMQGESDTDTLAHANAYQANLTKLIENVRADVGNANLPVVIGQINNAFTFTNNVRQAQHTVANNLAYVTLAQTDDLQRAAGDLIHFSTQGTLDLGNRFAAQQQLAVNDAAVGVNLLSNGSFETPVVAGFQRFVGGGITGWTAAGLDGVTLTRNTQFAGAPASNGAQWLSLETNGSLTVPNNVGTISQTFATTAGKTYIVEFDRAALSDGVERNWHIKYDVGGSQTSLTVNSKDVATLTLTPWTAKTFSFVATGPTTTLRFTGEALVNGFYGGAIDNVRAFETKTNLLVNGGFETPITGGFQGFTTGNNIGGWTALTNGSTLTNDAQFQNAQSSEGAQWMSLTLLNGTAGGVSQTFATVAGTVYELTFDYSALSHGDTTGANVVYEMLFDLGGPATQLNINTLGLPSLMLAPWQTHTVQFMATGASTTLNFRAGAGSYAGFYGPAIDNVWVTFIAAPAPEPATFTLLALGAAVFMRRRRPH